MSNLFHIADYKHSGFSSTESQYKLQIWVRIAWETEIIIWYPIKMLKQSQSL